LRDSSEDLSAAFSLADGNELCYNEVVGESLYTYTLSKLT